MDFTEEMIEKIWEKGRAMPDQDSTEWRKDQCGAWIRHDAYEQEHSDYGWKIVSVLPSDSGAYDHLRPFHRENGFNVASGSARCNITADRTSIRSTDHIDHPLNKSV